MKLILVTLIFLIPCFEFTFAGDRDRIPPEWIHFLPQGFPVSLFHGRGFSNSVHSLASDISRANPASLANFETPAAGISLEYGTRVDSANVLGIGLSRTNPLIPQSAGVVFPFSQVVCGIGFNRKYAGTLESREEIRTVQQPQGTGEFYTWKSKTQIFTGSGIVALSVNNPVLESHHFSIGFQVNGNYLDFAENLYKTSASATDIALSWKTGLRYRMGDAVQLGLIYENGADFSGTLDVKGINPTIELPDNGQFVPVEIRSRFKGLLPEKLSAGFQVQPLPWLAMAGSVTDIFWSEITDNQKNQVDFSGNFLIRGNDLQSYLIGFYRTGRNYRPGFYANDYQAFFLRAGFMLRQKNYDVYFVLSDSHLFSSELRQQTIFRSGINLNL